MTAKELAKRLHGRERRDEMTHKEEADAKAAGLVVVFGASDDLCEFRGAINDEVGCYGGVGILVHPTKGLADPDHKCDCEFCDFEGAFASKCLKLEAKWCELDGFSWSYALDVPHETFDIFEDGEPYCRGVVFHIDELKKVKA